MDPLCHTLVGASLGATGLARKTRYGTATLLIAANLPDVDGIAYFFGSAAYAFRRGITHGLPAMLVWPLVLALTVAAASRLGSNRSRGVSLRWLILLAAIGLATHPALDWLNTYGMRWLMPFDERWSYGDTLFIADWVVWLVLAGGLAASRWLRAARLPWYRRPALAALVLVLVYIGANFALTATAVRAALAHLENDPPRRLMASPVPLDPLEREIVLEYPNEYRFAKFRIGAQLRFALDGPAIAKGDPAVLVRAREQRDGRRFLDWARFPYSVTETERGKRFAYLADARYVRDLRHAPGGFGVVRVELAP